MSFAFQIETKVDCEGFYWKFREVVQVNDIPVAKQARSYALQWAKGKYPTLQVDAQLVTNPTHIDMVI